ncbi:hypothetical protein Y032_0194g1428 [Ancylostoma ceylanicum]|uniref:Uncharacterized protein n=1 Tax=Ancylostoma ceylanicum TaxID=53326 RepID=A0A016SQ06_9BILA|nr:hypothetical protein Y032_0194g1428 [Ancylostoma ceylanicum]
MCSAMNLEPSRNKCFYRYEITSVRQHLVKFGCEELESGAHAQRYGCLYRQLCLKDFLTCEHSRKSRQNNLQVQSDVSWPRHAVSLETTCQHMGRSL